MVTQAGAPVRYRIALPDAQERFVTLTKSLKTQLADAGYRPADITHVVLSHYHYDHSANTNDFDISGSMQGSGGIIKKGDGTMRLRAAGNSSRKRGAPSA
jgi:predicted metallo-beta-lactamase superfamily hydrolase